MFGHHKNKRVVSADNYFGDSPESKQYKKQVKQDALHSRHVLTQQRKAEHRMHSQNKQAQQQKHPKSLSQILDQALNDTKNGEDHNVFSSTPSDSSSHSSDFKTPKSDKPSDDTSSDSDSDSSSSGPGCFGFITIIFCVLLFSGSLPKVYHQIQRPLNNLLGVNISVKTVKHNKNKDRINKERIRNRAEQRFTEAKCTEFLHQHGNQLAKSLDQHYVTQGGTLTTYRNGKTVRHKVRKGSPIFKADKHGNYWSIFTIINIPPDSIASSQTGWRNARQVLIHHGVTNGYNFGNNRHAAPVQSSSES